MDDEELRAITKEQKKRRELLLKQLYIKQIVEQPAAHVWDMTIIAKELRLEVPFSRIEIKQHYRYFVGEGLIEHAIPEPPNNLNNASFTVVKGPFFPDTWLTHKGIVEVVKQLEAEKVARKETNADSSAGYLPASEEKRIEYAHLWSLMRELDNKYWRDYANEYSRDDPEPEDDDYRDYIALKTRKKPSLSKLRDIKRAGEAGRLKPYMEEIAKPPT